MNTPKPLAELISLKGKGARIALFLASELASYVHGALISVDGGFLSA